VPQSEQNPKQLAIGRLDEDLISRTVRELGIPSAQNLHPLFMFRLLRRLATDRVPQRVRDVTQPVMLQAIDASMSGPLPGLPEHDFVAVDFHHGPGFADSEANRQFAARVIDVISKRTAVILVDEANGLDGSTAHRGSVSRLPPAPPGTSILEWQLAYIERATAFVGSVRGLSYVAPLLGTASVAYYSDGAPNYEVQLAGQALRDETLGSLEVFAAQEFDARQVQLLDAVLAEKASLGIPQPVE
jgi:hypothetical protein